MWFLCIMTGQFDDIGLEAKNGYKSDSNQDFEKYSVSVSFIYQSSRWIFINQAVGYLSILDNPREKLAHMQAR